MKKAIVTIVLVLATVSMLAIQPASAFHWVVGFVEDAPDGTAALNHTIRIYYEDSPKNYYESTIGVDHSNDPNVQIDNCYLLCVDHIPNDFQSLNHNWQSTGRNVCIEVIDNGDGYVSDIVTVALSDLSWDLAPIIQLRER